MLWLAWIFATAGWSVAAWGFFRAARAHSECAHHCRTLAVVFKHLDRAQRSLPSTAEDPQIAWQAASELQAAGLVARERLQQAREGQF